VDEARRSDLATVLDNLRVLVVALASSVMTNRTCSPSMTNTAQSLPRLNSAPTGAFTVVLAPDDDADFDAVAVAETRGGTDCRSR
jgi:hypothetical protein